MYTIKLANGTVLENLELNGNNYISDTILEDSVFEGGLSEVVITNDKGHSMTYKDVILVHNEVEDNKSWFVIRPKTKQEKVLESINNAINSSDSNITDIQLALAEIYELIAQ